MDLRNDLINYIEQGSSNEDIVNLVVSNGHEKDDIIEELRCESIYEEEQGVTTKELFLEHLLNKLRSKIEGNNKFYKDINKHDIISALGHSQKAHVDASNKLYKVNKNIDELKEWIVSEMNIAEQSSKTQNDEHIKGLFLGQKLAYERILREVEFFDK